MQDVLHFEFHVRIYFILSFCFLFLFSFFFSFLADLVCGGDRLEPALQSLLWGNLIDLPTQGSARDCRLKPDHLERLLSADQCQRRQWEAGNDRNTNTLLCHAVIWRRSRHLLRADWEGSMT